MFIHLYQRKVNYSYLYIQSVLLCGNIYMIFLAQCPLASQIRPIGVTRVFVNQIKMPYLEATINFLIQTCVTCVFEPLSTYIYIQVCVCKSLVLSWFFLQLIEYIYTLVNTNYFYACLNLSMDYSFMCEQTCFFFFLINNRTEQTCLGMVNT